MRFSSSAVAVIGAAIWLSGSASAGRPSPPKTSADGTSGSLFGLLKSSLSSAPSVLSIRGGAVQEPSSLDQVEAALLRASAEGKLVVIDFTATWCGPCKMIAPIFHELSEQIDSVVFLKVDVDENPDTAAKYSVSAMPTFVFIKGWEVVDRLMGANPARLKEMIEELS